jgi:hypothetical protein
MKSSNEIGYERKKNHSGKLEHARDYGKINLTAQSWMSAWLEVVSRMLEGNQWVCMHLHLLRPLANPQM